MSKNLTLEVVTPQRMMLETEADYVTIPGEIGEVGILPGHIPLLTNLNSGVLSYKSSNEEKKLAVHFGYAEVYGDKVTILADVAEFANEIDAEKVKSDVQKAESELVEALKDPEKLALSKELRREIQIAATRLNTVS